MIITLNTREEGEEEAVDGQKGEAIAYIEYGDRRFHLASGGKIH